MTDPNGLLPQITDPVDPMGLLPSDGIDTVTPIKISEEDTFGGPVRSKEVGLDLAAQESPFLFDMQGGAVGAAFRSGDNFAYSTFKRLERESISPTSDPNYDPERFIIANRGRIPQTLETQFRLADSEIEANMILKDMTLELTDQEMLARRGGFSTFVARGLAGIVDLDTPLSVISGGAAAGLKGGIMATRWGRLAGSAAAGGLTQGAGQLIAFEAGTTGDWTSIPAAALGGMAFGALGGIGRRLPEDAANDAIGAAAREFDDYVADGTPLANRDIRAEVHVDDDVYQSRRMTAEAEMKELEPKPEGEAKGPQAFKLEDLELRPDSVGEADLGSSVGARQLNPQGSVASITNSRSTDIIADATLWAQQSGIPQQMYLKDSALAAKGAVGDAAAKQAARFHDALSASPIASDAQRLVRSGSVVAQRLAYDLMESGAGIWRNNRSAANLKDHYEKQLLGSFMPQFEDAYALHGKSAGMSWMDRKFNSQNREAFNRLVTAELNARVHDAPGTQRSLAPGVKEAADAHDRWSALDIEVGRGRPNEGSIKGYENIKSYSGYMSQKWVGHKFENLIRSGKTVQDISDAISEAYRSAHPNMKKADSDLWAKAVVRRARNSDRGTDASLISMLQQDGRGYLEEMLQNNGMPAGETKRLIDTLTGEAAARGQAGHTKGRIDVDMRFTASNGIQMMDLFDTDLAKIVARRARGTSGNAALARKGILSRTDRADIKEAILQEQQARGPSQKTGTTVREKVADAIDEDKHLTGDEIDELFSYFDSGPVAGGVSPLYGNMKKLTNLALLNQLGLTQLAETGAQIATVGLQRWWDHAGDALKEAMGNPSSKLADELRHMSVLVPEDRLFRDDFNLEMDRAGTAQSELAQKVTTLLDRGQRIQGYTSGFYAVRNFQQRVAVTSAADKIMSNMKGLRNDLSSVRAEDIGLDPATFARVKQYVDNGTVEFLDGNLHKLNFQQWKPEDVEDFALSLNRHVNQVVQKAMIGESSVLFHRDGVASLFFHLKSFSMLAMEKQALRNLRIGDTEALASFFAGLGTAAAAYSIRQAINGNTQNLTLDKVSRGAIGYNSMTGWLPMWTDPVMNVLGIDSLKFNTYAQGIDSNVIGVPAAWPTLNKMANIFAVPGNVVTEGGLTNNDIRALQTTPLVGNAYGISAILNAMKD